MQAGGVAHAVLAGDALAITEDTVAGLTVNGVTLLAALEHRSSHLEGHGFNHSATLAAGVEGVVFPIGFAGHRSSGMRAGSLTISPSGELGGGLGAQLGLAIHVGEHLQRRLGALGPAESGDSNHEGNRQHIGGEKVFQEGAHSVLHEFNDRSMAFFGQEGAGRVRSKLRVGCLNANEEPVVR